MSQTLLKATLDSVVEECVSFVGVDINICSEVLLRWDKSVAEDHGILSLTGCLVEIQLEQGDTYKVVKYRKSMSSYIALGNQSEGKTSFKKRIVTVHIIIFNTANLKWRAYGNYWVH